MLNLIIGEPGSGKSAKLILDYYYSKSILKEDEDILVLQCWPCRYTFPIFNDDSFDEQKNIEEAFIQSRHPLLTDSVICFRFDPFIKKIKEKKINIKKTKYIFIDEIHHASYPDFIYLLYKYNKYKPNVYCYGHRLNKKEGTLKDSYYNHLTMNHILNNADNIKILKKGEPLC